VEKNNKQDKEAGEGREGMSDLRIDSMTADEFGRRIAKTILESSSSSAFFFVQKALEDIEPFGVEWEEARNLLERISKEEPHD
jgi:hypothetical protein